MDRTVTFFPVVWYMRDLAEINDTLTSSNGGEVSAQADLKHTVILLNKQETEYVAIPFVIVKSFQQNCPSFAAASLKPKWKQKH